MRARHDDSFDSSIESTLPGFAERELVGRRLEDVLDEIKDIIEDQLEYIRGKSDPPPSCGDDRPTLPSLSRS